VNVLTEDMAINEIRALASPESNYLFLLETFLTFLSEQQREIDLLRSITLSLASEREDLSKKLEDMDKWREEREPMLTEIDEFVKQARERLDQNR